MSLDIKGLLGALQKIDSDYTYHWIDESFRWQELGLYHHASRMLALQPGQIHIDIGSGINILLANLASHYPDSFLLGIERNESMAAMGHQLALQSSLRSNVYCNVSLDAVTDTTLQTTFDPDEALFAELRMLELPGVINVVVDDVRAGTVMRKLLGNRLPHSASFILPGVGPRISYEHPYHARDQVSDIESRQRSILAHVAETRAAVYRLVSELIPPGGRFVVGERYMPFKPSTNAEIACGIRTAIDKVAPGFFTYWDPTEFSVLKDVPREGTTKLQWTGESKGATQNGGTVNAVTAVLHAFERNKTPVAR